MLKHTALDRSPYTYLIAWTSLGKFYYGRRTAKNCHPDEFWIKYFTSSKEVKKMRENHGEPDRIEIRKIFDDAEKCKKWEYRFLKKIDAENNINFLNIVASWPSMNPLITGPCSKQRRDAISDARKNTKRLRCEFCGKETDPGNYKQYHGENCKKNPNHDREIWKTRTERGKLSYEKQKKNGNYNPPILPIGIFKCPHCDTKNPNHGYMKRYHFDRCNKNPDSEFFEKKRPTLRPIVCIGCHKLSNHGRIEKSHNKCFQHWLNLIDL